MATGGGRFLLWGALLLACPSAAPQGGGTAQERLGSEVLRELVETNTTQAGSTTEAARKMAARFVAAGFPDSDVVLVESAPRKGNLVVRYRARTAARRPVLFLAHLDVVEARREDWSFDPWTLLEREGYFYGRGTLDVKGGAATLVTAFLRLRAEGF